ncbi:small G protein signaling modulator 1-like [Manis pentadactyla]|uniref:small G protein signaling modulator 1-like n=1 Tax=Manis pentadactyla TaxID=143292 RepID=UPI00255CA7B3|nr:small G protein signaling modulator 1-like [Manis pentadactyla]
MKVGKSFPPAEELSCKVQDLEHLIESTRNQIQGLQENVQKLPKLPSLSPLAIKHLWICTALFEKVLDKIVHYLVENSSKHYEKEALLMDPVDGPILVSLLVGPCALEYTKMKTADHFWTHPLADELLQRHRIHSSHLRQDSPTKRPALWIQKRHSSGSMDDRPSSLPMIMLSPCTRTPGPPCSMARTTCWSSRGMTWRLCQDTCPCTRRPTS